MSAPEAPTFLLDVATDRGARRATLRLSLHLGSFIAAHEVALAAHPAARWHALFDTRRHVRTHAKVTPVEEQLAEIGRFLGEEVLGEEIAGALAKGVASRTLLVRLPGDPEDRLAAAFARVPWELAVTPGVEGSLGSRNVVVRATLEGAEPAEGAAIAFDAKEAVRVLLVFADAPDERPLAARLERERLLDLFFEEVMQELNVEVDVLCHGVTRARIEDQVRAKGGYHVVHWSGHGHVNTLDIARDQGEKAAPRLRGEDLAALFAKAGGFIPPVVFLSACHSGSMVTVKDWESLRASLGEGVRESRDPALDQVLEDQPGFAGTALSLLRAGVKQVVAMRYEVGDGYARRLARRVYRGMFAHPAHYSVDAAVALARGQLMRDVRRGEEHDPVDHATPLVFGSEPVRLVPGRKRSAQAERRWPKPQPLLPSKDLDRPHNFVGRGEDLIRLSREWLQADDEPIALIQGLAGLGKTSLAAEAVHLWFDRFDHVFAFQAKGGPLAAETFLERLDQRLIVTMEAYRERCKANPLARVYLAPGTEGLSPPVREDLLWNNLVDVLAPGRVLLVLDNFETNLLTTGACKDPAWDRLLETLANRLESTQSRVLLTSRHKPAALEGKALWLPLGPLPTREAALFFQGHAPLRGLWYGDDAAKALAQRILYVSRGHPLILGRLADLARGYHDKTHGLTQEGRQALTGALDKIEGAGYKRLPDLFAGVRSDREREQERKYLEDVAVGAVDLLIERLSPEARTLLWIVTRVGEPPTGNMIGAVVGSDPARRLDEISAIGLLVREADDSYAFHELVAERVAAWMDRNPGERRGQTEAEVSRAYGQRYAAAFQVLLRLGKREAALDTGRRAIRYLVRARAFESLMGVASGMVTSTADPSLLGPVIADLQAAAGEVPAGKARWTLRATLAGALLGAGRPAEALPFFALAASDAEAAEQWSDMGWISQNWANALLLVGQLDLARATFLRSADAERRAGSPRVLIAMSELEALRIDVMQGLAERACPVIEEQLADVRGFWARRARGEPVPDAPDGEVLARALVSALDVAMNANHALERWQVCLDLLGEIEQVKRALGASEHDLARTRFNSHGPLLNLGKLPQAKAVLEGCLEIFRRTDDVTREANALTALADVWSRLDDPEQAAVVEQRALALRNRLPDAGSRALSHCNLANYLHAIDSRREAGAHHLADLAYLFATGLDPRVSLHNLAVHIHQAAAGGGCYDLPQLADILRTPAFASLRAYLADHDIPAADLQTRIDAALAPLRAAALAEPTPEGDGG